MALKQPWRWNKGWTQVPSLAKNMLKNTIFSTVQWAMVQVASISRRQLGSPLVTLTWRLSPNSPIWKCVIPSQPAEMTKTYLPVYSGRTMSNQQQQFCSWTLYLYVCLCARVCDFSAWNPGFLNSLLFWPIPKNIWIVWHLHFGWWNPHVGSNNLHFRWWKRK